MIESLVNQFDSLTKREKIIAVTTLIILVWWAWDTFFYQSLSTQRSQVKTELSNIKNQLSAQQRKADQIEALGKLDPNLSNKQKLKEIQTEFNKLKQQLDFGSKKFVPAYSMAEVLGDMLRKNNRLKLIHLETLPVSTLSKNDAQKSWVYRHGLSLTLSGNYLNTLNYLKSLESLPWRLNWGSIDYQVKEFPIAETTLQVYTLSFEENWLGL